MHPVLALETDSALRRRIRAGVRSGAANELFDGVRFAATWRDLRALARRFEGSPAFVDPFVAGGQEALAEANAFQRSYPACTMVLYAAMDVSRRAQVERSSVTFAARLTPDLGDRFVVIGAVALRLICHHEVRALSRRLKEATPASARGLVDCLLAGTMTPCPVDDLAGSLGISVRTLRRRCAASGLPSPRRLIALARIFHVERLARWSGRPSGAVALVLGYSDYANYSRAVRNELGCQRSAMTERGGSDYVAGRLLRLLGSRPSAITRL